MKPEQIDAKSDVHDPNTSENPHETPKQTKAEVRDCDQITDTAYNESLSPLSPGEVSGSHEHTGRWTKQEHDMFLEGLKQYGKEWKKIAGLVKTRTPVQIRTHAQKYFLKLSKMRGHPPELGSLSNFGLDNIQVLQDVNMHFATKPRDLSDTEAEERRKSKRIRKNPNQSDEEEMSGHSAQKRALEYSSDEEGISQSQISPAPKVQRSPSKLKAKQSPAKQSPAKPSIPRPQVLPSSRGFEPLAPPISIPSHMTTYPDPSPRSLEVAQILTMTRHASRNRIAKDPFLGTH